MQKDATAALPDTGMEKVPTAAMQDQKMETQASATADKMMAGDSKTAAKTTGTPPGMMDDHPMETPGAMEEHAMSATPSAMMDAHGMGTPAAGMQGTPEAMKDDSMMGGTQISAPAFFQAELTDASSGETFRLQDFQGKVVLVETLAMWCPKCLQQQQQIKALHEMLGMREDFVSVGLDVDPNERLEDLQGYILKNGFDWKYAVAGSEVAREIGQLYGDQFLNPSSTPMFIIDRHGMAHPLPFGIKSAEDLKAALEPFLKEGM